MLHKPMLFDLEKILVLHRKGRKCPDTKIQENYHLMRIKMEVKRRHQTDKIT